MELDALRGIASIAVVLFHFTSRYAAIYPGGSESWFQFPLGHYGVQLFFVISGFVIFLTLEKRPSGIDFAAARFIRLYPTYWAAVVLTFGVVSIVGLPGRETSLAEAVVNLTMLQGFVGIPHVDGVYWTLTLELVFYAIILGLYKVGVLRHTNAWCAVWLGVIALAWIVETSGTHVHGAIRTLLLLNYGQFFIAGVTIRRIVTDGPSWRAASVLVGCVLVDFLIGSQESAVVFCGILLFFSLAVAGRLPLLRTRPLLILGGMSYPLYLVHQNIGYVVIQSMDGRGIPQAALLASATVVVLAFAYVLHTYIELPSQERLRELWRNRRHAQIRNRISPQPENLLTSPPTVRSTVETAGRP